jgi:kynurenine formamidase
MRIRSFIIAYALVLALVLFADRRQTTPAAPRYSRVLDLTVRREPEKTTEGQPSTQIVSPAELIPGTWSSGEIPAERLIAPLVVLDLESGSKQLTVDRIATWEGAHGVIPQGSVVAIRGGASASVTSLPIETDAAQFLMDARYVLGFIVGKPVDFSGDRTLPRQLALHGNYVVEGASGLSDLPATGSLVIVAPTRDKNTHTAAVRVLAMIR